LVVALQSLYECIPVEQNPPTEPVKEPTKEKETVIAAVDLPPRSSASKPPTDDGEEPRAPVQSALQANPDKSRGEVSAATIARMMGGATALEMKVVEQKIDHLSTKINTMALKVDRIMSAVTAAPSGSDLERIDLQIGQLKNLLREILTSVNDLHDSREEGK
jgi:hypothetical protein